MRNIIFVDAEKWKQRQHLLPKKDRCTIGEIIPVDFKKWRRFVPKEKKMSDADVTRAIVGSIKKCLPEKKGKPEPPKGA